MNRLPTATVKQASSSTKKEVDPSIFEKALSDALNTTDQKELERQGSQITKTLRDAANFDQIFPRQGPKNQEHVDKLLQSFGGMSIAIPLPSTQKIKKEEPDENELLTASTADVATTPLSKPTRRVNQQSNDDDDDNNTVQSPKHLVARKPAAQKQVEEMIIAVKAQKKKRGGSSKKKSTTEDDGEVSDVSGTTSSDAEDNDIVEDNGDQPQPSIAKRRAAHKKRAAKNFDTNLDVKLRKEADDAASHSEDNGMVNLGDESISKSADYDDDEMRYSSSDEGFYEQADVVVDDGEDDIDSQDSTILRLRAASAARAAARVAAKAALNAKKNVADDDFKTNESDESDEDGTGSDDNEEEDEEDNDDDNNDDEDDEEDEDDDDDNNTKPAAYNAKKRKQGSHVEITITRNADDDDDDGVDEQPAKRKNTKSSVLPRTLLSTAEKSAIDDQLDRKRKRKEASAQWASASVFQDIVYIAATNVFIVLTRKPDEAVPQPYRDIVMRDKSDDPLVKRWRKNLMAVEALIQESLALFQKFAPSVYREMADMVTNCKQVSVSTDEKNTTHVECELTDLKLPPEEIACFEMVHFKKPTETMKKRMFAAAKLEQTIKAMWFLTNFQMQCESAVKERLRHIPGFVNGETNAREAIKLLQEDTTKNAVYKTLITQLGKHLNIVDQAASVLAKLRLMAENKL